MLTRTGLRGSRSITLTPMVLRVVRILSVGQEIVTQTVIAARTGVSHAAVYLWQKRPDFPEPFPCAGKGRFYSWDEVLEWYAGYSKNNETGETDEQVQG